MIANQIAGLLGVASTVVATDYESIATTTVGVGGSASITFSGISGSYSHLQIRGNVKSNRASGINDGIVVQFNSDTGTNYTRHRLFGDGSTAQAGANTAQNGSLLYAGSGALTGTSVFGAFVMDLIDYSNTNKYKTMRSLDGVDGNGSGYVALDSGLWLNTAAITSVTFTPQSGTLFTQYSSFALYGIK